MKKKVLNTNTNPSLLLVVEIILELGNAILQNLGVEDKIDDVEVFLR